MSIELWQFIGHAGITLVAVVGLALRLEHRLTKIETDVEWLRDTMNPGLKGDCDNAEDSGMDSA